MLRAASCQACKNLEKFLPPHSFIYIYIYIYIYMNVGVESTLA